MTEFKTAYSLARIEALLCEIRDLLSGAKPKPNPKPKPKPKPKPLRRMSQLSARDILEVVTDINSETTRKQIMAKHCISQDTLRQIELRIGKKGKVTLNRGLSDEQKLELADRAVKGEDIRALQAEFDVSDTYIRDLVRELEGE